MASFHAHLVLGEQAGPSDVISAPHYPITICKQHMRQHLDERGRPSSQVYPGQVELTMPVPTGTDLIAWARDPHKTLTCHLIFQDLEGLIPSLTLRLEQAYCVSYGEHFQPDVTGQVAFFCQLTIAAERIIKHGTDFKTRW